MTQTYLKDNNRRIDSIHNVWKTAVIKFTHYAKQQKTDLTKA